MSKTADLEPRLPRIHVALTDSVIDTPALHSYLDHPDVGAHCWFHGVTRRSTQTADGKTLQTESLSYEAHRPMAASELRRLATDAAERFGLLAVVIVHRLGKVPVKQSSVVMGCSSPHRPPCFAAPAWMMDELKRDVPIWKRELFTDGSTEWQHPAQGPRP